jgi:hypothetical protein
MGLGIGLDRRATMKVRDLGLALAFCLCLPQTHSFAAQNHSKTTISCKEAANSFWSQFQRAVSAPHDFGSKDLVSEVLTIRPEVGVGERKLFGTFALKKIEDVLATPTESDQYPGTYRTAIKSLSKPVNVICQNRQGEFYFLSFYFRYLNKKWQLNRIYTNQ